MTLLNKIAVGLSQQIPDTVGVVITAQELELNRNRPVPSPETLKILETGTDINYFKLTATGIGTLILKWKYWSFLRF